MADDFEDDKWLYGETGENTTEPQPNNEANDEQQPEERQEPTPIPQVNSMSDGPPGVDDGPPGVDDEQLEEGDRQVNGQEVQDGMEDGEVRQNGDDSDKEDLDDDSDDDVNVVIGEIKATAPSYTSLNIKRGGLQTAVGDRSKQIQQQQQQPGKFSVEEFDQVGTINGVPSTEYNLDSLEDKPWRKPGADITDYFNYGFNEDTWRAYCERQKRLRVSESGVGLVPANPTGLPLRGPIPITNDNSKYAGVGGGVVAASAGYVGVQRGAMPMTKSDQPKVNAIQVMTADRREYSRKPNFPDLSMPPPGSFETFQPEYGFNPEPEPFYGGYEPVQDLQWGTEPNPNWAPSDLKTLTGPPPSSDSPMRPPHSRSPGGSRKDRERESPSRERGESRARSEKRERSERDRSHRRERSRSRGRSRRKSKSRSRSPSHRSHRKKKSRRHEDSE